MPWDEEEEEEDLFVFNDTIEGLCEIYVIQTKQNLSSKEKTKKILWICHAKKKQSALSQILVILAKISNNDKIQNKNRGCAQLFDFLQPATA